ncbi:Protein DETOXIFICATION 41 [Asimina triloba]
MEGLGMASAVQTVCGQAYGAKKYSSMGIICQKAMILHVGAAVLLTFLYWFSGPFLVAIGQTQAISEQGQIFARGLIPQLYAFALNCPMQRFLQAQNIVNPLAYIAVGVFLLHVLLTWLGVFVLGYGLLGAALILSFSWWLLVILTLLYILFSPSYGPLSASGPTSSSRSHPHSCSGETTSPCPPDFCPISTLPPPPLILLLARGLQLGNMHELLELGHAIHAGFLRCYKAINQLILHLICSIRVGNELGAAHPKLARFSVFVVTATSISISIIFSVIVLVLRTPLSQLFTTDESVIKAVSNLTPLLAISVFLNGIQPILSGVAVGSGWQALVAYVNLATYYIIGLPIGCVIGFKTSLEGAGIWWGMIFGVVLQSAALIILTARTNWNKEVDKAIDRLKASANEDTQSLVDTIA